jgi:hypothetical protein
MSGANPWTPSTPDNDSAESSNMLCQAFITLGVLALKFR